MRGPARQRGLAMVEFVIATPILLLLMFGSFEFGRFMIQYSILNDAVRNASRYVAGAALDGTDGLLLTGTGWSTLVTKGKNLAVYGNVGGTGTALLPSLNVGQITVTEDTTNLNITVAAAYPYAAAFGGAIPKFFTAGSLSTTYTLNISTTMKAL